jgi:hypothetical protein
MGDGPDEGVGPEDEAGAEPAGMMETRDLGLTSIDDSRIPHVRVRAAAAALLSNGLRMPMRGCQCQETHRAFIHQAFGLADDDAAGRFLAPAAFFADFPTLEAALFAFF